MLRGELFALGFGGAESLSEVGGEGLSYAFRNHLGNLALHPLTYR